MLLSKMKNLKYTLHIVARFSHNNNINWFIIFLQCFPFGSIDFYSEFKLFYSASNFGDYRSYSTINYKSPMPVIDNISRRIIFSLS